MKTKTHWKFGFTFVLVFSLGLTACTASESSSNLLIVSAASSLVTVFTELEQLFEDETGINVTFSFGSSGAASQQIESGAPIDLFASANMQYIENLNQRNLIDSDTIQQFARGQLALWTSLDQSVRLESLEGLAHPGIRRIAMANPEHAPYGVAARQALQSIGLWEKLQRKLIFGENVRQAFQYAENGEVDAAIVSLSLIIGSVGHWIVVSTDLYEPIEQVMAVVRSSKQPGNAIAFSKFLLSPVGRDLLIRHGFNVMN